MVRNPAINLLPACVSLLLACAMPASSGAQAHDARVSGVRILEKGVYRAVTLEQQNKGIEAAPDGVRAMKLLTATTTVPARQWVRFGLRYAVAGGPAGAQIDLKLVTKFPPAGLFDPRSGVRHFQLEYVLRRAIGRAYYRDFHLDHIWEVVAGVWTFEFWHRNRKIGEQEFCVVTPPSNERNAPAAPLEEPCRLLLSENSEGRSKKHNRAVRSSGTASIAAATSPKKQNDNSAAAAAPMVAASQVSGTPRRGALHTIPMAAVPELIAETSLAIDQLQLR